MEVHIEENLWDSFPFFDEIKTLFNFSVEFKRFRFRDPHFLAYIRVRDPEKRTFYEPLPLEIENERKGLIQGVIYDGLELLRYFLQSIEISKPAVLITDRLIATFGDDGRYHLRMIVMGAAAIISLKGILYAPAKSPEYYIKTSLGLGDRINIDVRKVLRMLLLQFYAYFKYDEIFCSEERCMLYNCHTTEEIERVRGLCKKHAMMLEGVINL
jgi:hypothetical protein